MRVWKLAAAAAAMVLGASPAWAVNFVQYTIAGIGAGTFTPAFPSFDPPRATNVFVKVQIVVDTDAGSSDYFRYVSTGSTFTFSAFPFSASADFTDDSIDGRVFSGSHTDSALVNFDSNGLIYGQASGLLAGIGRGDLTFSFATQATDIRPVNQFQSFITTIENAALVPEPTTWGLMLAGFGLVGSAMRRRRIAFAAA